MNEEVRIKNEETGAGRLVLAMCGGWSAARNTAVVHRGQGRPEAQEPDETGWVDLWIDGLMDGGDGAGGRLKSSKRPSSNIQRSSKHQMAHVPWSISINAVAEWQPG